MAALRKIIYGELSDYLTDKQETNFGELYAHRPSIARLAYLIKINNPATPEQIDALAEHAKGHSHHIVRDLYGEFHGLDIFMSTFFIYGLQGSVDRGSFLDAQNIPFDSVPLQTYARPKFAPRGFILGKYCPKGADIIIDVITPDGEIVCGRFIDSATVVHKFATVEKWLKHRVKDAAKDYNK